MGLLTLPTIKLDLTFLEDGQAPTVPSIGTVDSFLSDKNNIGSGASLRLRQLFWSIALRLMFL